MLTVICYESKFLIYPTNACADLTDKNVEIFDLFQSLIIC